MKNLDQIPEVAELVHYLMPEADEESLKEATRNLRAYLAVVYRIFLMLEADGKLYRSDDNTELSDKVSENKTN